MGRPLTLKQTIAISSQKAVPPLRVDLAKLFGSEHGSLLAIRDLVQTHKDLFIEQVRNVSILSTSSNFADLLTKWVETNAEYNSRVAGVISGAGNYRPGIVLGRKGSSGEGNASVALIGRVYCKVHASHAPIPNWRYVDDVVNIWLRHEGFR